MFSFIKFDQGITIEVKKILLYRYNKGHVIDVTFYLKTNTNLFGTLAMAGKTSFGIDNAVVGQFIFYALIVLLKMMLMSFITVIRRNLNQVRFFVHTCRQRT